MHPQTPALSSFWFLKETLATRIFHLFVFRFEGKTLFGDHIFPSGDWKKISVASGRLPKKVNFRPTKSAILYQSFFSETGLEKFPRNSREIGHFFREFVPENPAKFDFFFCDLPEALIGALAELFYNNDLLKFFGCNVQQERNWEFMMYIPCYISNGKI